VNSRAESAPLQKTSARLREAWESPSGSRTKWMLELEAPSWHRDRAGLKSRRVSRRLLQEGLPSIYAWPEPLATSAAAWRWTGARWNKDDSSAV